MMDTTIGSYIPITQITSANQTALDLNALIFISIIVFIVGLAVGAAIAYMWVKNDFKIRITSGQWS